MPQLTQFPFVGALDPSEAVIALITLCRETPREGESFKSFRRRLKTLGLWDAERYVDTLRFLHMATGDLIVPSLAMRTIAEADGNNAARDALAERLWYCNPILIKVVVERLAERVYPSAEVVGFVDSSAYPGTPVPRRQLDSWLWLCRGLDIIKMLGVALALDSRGQVLLERARALGIDDFLEEDEPEPEPEPTPLPTAEAESPEPQQPDAPTAASPAPVGSATAVRAHGSPLGRDPAISLSEFAGHELFCDAVTAETTSRLEAWWSEEAPHPQRPSHLDFGLDNDRWIESSEETLYRLAVAAAFCFRLEHPGLLHAFTALDSEGVLDSLYYGHAPEALSAKLDPQALLLASLVARRSAAIPDLAARLEQQKSAGGAFALLEETFGRGFFRLELFWMMGALADLGALRFADLPDYTSLPNRNVRDTLFRLGFLVTPYAHDSASLVIAAAAARRAAGSAAPADEVLASFAAAAGCRYDCPHRARCDYACRERAELV